MKRCLLPLLLLPFVGITPHAHSQAQTPLPEAPHPTARPLQPHTAAQQAGRLHFVNGYPYHHPTHHDLFADYINDSYLLPAFIRSTTRALYTEALDEPKGWGQDWAGYGQRQGSSEATTAINGNVRLAMELAFHEDLRYIPCRGCSVKRKIANALLVEFTARHGDDGHRFFTLTPTIADFSGPIIAHSLWYPDGPNPFGGVVATRTVFATRVGLHLVQEFKPHPHHPHPETP
jgi:hypothetical protein